MKKQISDVYENTADAVLVNKHIDCGASSMSFIMSLIVKTFKNDILEEAKRLESEDTK